MKIQASLEPLKGKYYGSEIKLVGQEDSTHEAYIQVWVNGISIDYAPSEREYDFVDEDGKFMVYDEYEDQRTAYEYEISDDHYETQAALTICNKIVEALNGLEI